MMNIQKKSSPAKQCQSVSHVIMKYMFCALKRKWKETLKFTACHNLDFTLFREKNHSGFTTSDTTGFQYMLLTTRCDSIFHVFCISRHPVGALTLILTEKAYIFCYSLFTESENMQSWKGPIRIITSNPWFHMWSPKNWVPIGLHIGMNRVVYLAVYFAWLNEAAAQKIVFVQAKYYTYKV